MSGSSALSLEQVQAVFEEEIACRCGTIKETIQASGILFTRSILPLEDDVKPGDRVQGGVALRATDDQISLHPYVFRQVCTNGAIMAESRGSTTLDDLAWCDPEEVEVRLREALVTCCLPEHFQTSVREMRRATSGEVDLLLTMMPLLSRMGTHMMEQLLPQIMRRFRRDRDRSRFGLMNAVTSLARDTDDPEERWNLEELGGGIALTTSPRSPSGVSSRRSRRVPAR